MARRKVSAQFRSRLSEKLMDLGNLIIIAMTFGQFVSGVEFSLPIFLTGVIISILCYIIAYIVGN